MWNETVKVNSPYDFEKVLDRMSLDPLNNIDLAEKMITVPIYQTKEIAVICSIGTMEQPAFYITGQDPATKSVVLNELKRIFQWETSLKEVNAHFSDTVLKDIFEEHSGTPIVLEFDPYACLIKSIIHQQLNLAFSFKLTERYVKAFGEEIDGIWFYPSPERAALITVEELRDMQFSQKKAEYIIGLSHLITDKTISLEKLQQASREEVVQTLIKVRGIGQWTIENFLLFGLGRHNEFPVQDIGLQRAIQKLMKMERKPTPAELLLMSKDWSPYLSYASLYLWRSIEKGK
ncbi:DNA-3-methyladenine glycosylase II [Bacillus ectoiniformans]|uniref:DNA-3-methyladenine glycosylase family protein n=1 Tax=Bacillus ectoiniformans TaxID=1494429 RepID=UPI0019561774|nr:DNA-3-methyladenine glycosylase [Bacillus ectoiniformans]MBM7650232.1 DNA-3-methyladenine glycosylase II [Bacillus ectoiniformans]